VKARRKLEHSTTKASTSRSIASTSGSSVFLPRRRGAPSAGLDHRGRHERRRRLAVGARHRDHRAGAAGAGLLPPVGQLELAAHRHTRAGRDREERVALGETRARCHQLDAGDERRERCARRGLDQLDAEPGRGTARRVGDLVVGHRDPPAAGQQRAGGGDAGDGQAVDERGRGHATPICRAKSA
jgi:hypothetical protein